MESIAVAVNVPALHVLSSRDYELNEKAFQRALMKTKSSSENHVYNEFSHSRIQTIRRSFSRTDAS